MKTAEDAEDAETAGASLTMRVLEGARNEIKNLCVLSVLRGLHFG
jgi:hypothetical protein